MILQMIKDLQQKKSRQRIWLDFLDEVRTNWENYHVMDQTGRVKFFQLNAWARLKAVGGCAVDKEVTAALEILQEYNHLAREFKDYEQWYNADINRKTRENGVILHEKREAAQKKFQEVAAVVEAMRSALERQLVQMGIIK